MIGRHLIPFFPEKAYIQQSCSKSHDDLISDLMIGRHLIPLFPKNNLLQKMLLLQTFLRVHQYISVNLRLINQYHLLELVRGNPVLTIHIFVVTTTFWGISSIQEQLKYSISTRERYMRLDKALNIGSSNCTLSRYSLVTDGL